MSPIRRGAVVLVGPVPISEPVVLRQRVDRIRGRVLQLLGRERNDVTIPTRVEVELAPWDRMIFFADAKKPAQAHDCEHDAVRRLVEHDVLDLADRLTGTVIDVRTDGLARA